MTFLLFLCGLAFTVLFCFIFASLLAKEKTVKWLDKDFQIWAFGEVLEDTTPLYQVVDIWNKKNPEYKLPPEDGYMKSITKMKDLYKSHKKR